ncbi:MAG: hypothetical protein ACQEQC_08245 [Elusimicrobiota bacterium]
MNNKIKYLVVTAVLLLLVVPSSHGTPVNIEGIQNLGMGGPGTAFDSHYGPMYNPAILGIREETKITILDFPVTVTNDVFKFYSFYSDNQDDLKNFSDLDSDRQQELTEEITDKVSKYNMRAKFGILNPGVMIGPFPILGPTGSLAWGVGFKNQTDIGAKMNPGILVPTINFWARADGVLFAPVVYSTPYLPWKLPGKIHAGITLKSIMRYRYEENRMSILEFENFDFNSDDLENGLGGGWDWGALYEFDDKWNFSFVIKDFLSSKISYSGGKSEVIKPRVNFGASYKVLDSLTLAADIRDFKLEDTYKSTLFTKLYFGGRYSLLRILNVRAGFYQGYPTFGVGLGEGFNYAFYGRELGRYPGTNPEWNHSISFTTRF